MIRTAAWIAAIVATGCSQLFGLDPPAHARDAAGDVRQDEGATVDAALMWSMPIIAITSGLIDDDPCATGDLLEMYFNRAADIYVTTRVSTLDPWGAPTVVAELSTASLETAPEVTADGLLIFFTSDRAGSMGRDIWYATRSDRTIPWGIPQLVTNLNSASDDFAGGFREDTLGIVFTSNRPGGAGGIDIYRASRAVPSGPFANVTRIAEVATAVDEDSASLAGDGSVLYFNFVPQGSSTADVYEAPSDAIGQFGPVGAIDELDTASNERDLWVSPDGTYALFVSDRSGVDQIYSATR